ncbi:tetratricopeptide repeat protein [bacterium]|nr:tetratricopeptide repeat protein [bacterium]
MDLAEKTITVQQMFTRIRKSLQAHRASRGQDAAVQGPFFTFLIGAGFSVTAGVPTTAHLVRALEYWEERRGQFEDALEETKDLEDGGGRVTERYFQLMNHTLPDVSSRRDFIAAAIRWARARNVQMNRESILLATLLLAGSGQPVPMVKREREGAEGLLKAFARCAYTTNFDELMPTTFYLGNQVADIIDEPVPRSAGAIPDHPAVVYLHGRHLHYNLANTEREMQGGRGGGEAGAPLCLQFSRALESTGLIVIGYSGAEDCATRAIAGALSTGGHLPRGLYWGVHGSPDNLHQDVKQLIANRDDAFLLGPGSAQATMEAILKELGVAVAQTKVEWMENARRVLKALQGWFEDFRSDLEEFLAAATKATMEWSSVAAEPVLEQWRGGFKEKVEKCIADDEGFDRSLAAQVYYEIGRCYAICYSFSPAKASLEAALELHREVGSKFDEAWDLQELGSVLGMQGDYAQAREYLQQALEQHREVGSKLGEAQDLVELGGLEVLQGNESRAMEYFEQAIALYTGAGMADAAANVELKKSWYLLLAGKFSESLAASENVLASGDASHEERAAAYYNLCHAKWLAGDSEAIALYRAGAEKHRALSDAIADFELFVQRGMVERERVLGLLRELGLERDPE